LTLPPRRRFSLDSNSETQILFLLYGNSAFADIDLYTRGRPPLLVKLIADDRTHDGECADDKIENVAIHDLVSFWSRKLATKRFSFGGLHAVRFAMYERPDAFQCNFSGSGDLRPCDRERRTAVNA
jgi:hypothetical protein